MRKQLIATLACVLSLLSLTSAEAAAIQLLDVQPNQHWRAGLVEQADTLVTKRIEQARQAGELGCRDYCAVLANVFSRVTVVASAQLPDRAPVAWQLIVIRSAGEDAYAMADGRIVISEAFIKREQLNVDELAFVLAHEASHVILAHEADTLDTVQALMPHGVNQSVQDIYAAMDFNMGLLFTIAPLVVRMEEEADHTGLMLAALAGFNPDTATGYVERISRIEQQTLVATHPQGARRLTQLRETLPLARRIYQRFSQPVL